MSGFDNKGWDVNRQPYYEGLADKYGLPVEVLRGVVCGEGKWGWGQSTSKNAKKLYGGYEDSWGPLQMYLGNGLGRDCMNALGLNEDQFRSGEYEQEIADYGIKVMAKLYKAGLQQGIPVENRPKATDQGGTRCADKFGLFDRHGRWYGNKDVAECIIKHTWHGYKNGGTSCGAPNDLKGPGGSIMPGDAPDAGINGEKGWNGNAPREAMFEHNEMATNMGSEWDDGSLD